MYVLLFLEKETVDNQTQKKYDFLKLAVLYSKAIFMIYLIRVPVVLTYIHQKYDVPEIGWKTGTGVTILVRVLKILASSKKFT